MKQTKRIIKQVEKEIVTKVICDTCKQESKDWYISLGLSSEYPECDGDEYQFCSHDCFIEYLKHMPVWDLTRIAFISQRDISKEVTNND